MTRVIHVTTGEQWERSRERGSHGTDRIAQEGFLHMCTPAQLAGVLERHFGTADGLVGLVADADALGDALRWESTPPSDERFPHLYRELATAEVQSVRPLTELLQQKQL